MEKSGTRGEKKSSFQEKKRNENEFRKQFPLYFPSFRRNQQSFHFLSIFLNDDDDVVVLRLKEFMGASALVGSAPVVSLDNRDERVVQSSSLLT